MRWLAFGFLVLPIGFVSAHPPPVFIGTDIIRPLRMVSYNAMRCVATDRRFDFLQHDSYADVVLLKATRLRRHSTDIPISIFFRWVLVGYFLWILLRAEFPRWCRYLIAHLNISH